MAKKNDDRKACYTFVLYPDSAIPDWRNYLDSLMIPILVSPLHDSDFLPDGSLKKSHYHVMLDFGTTKKSWQQVYDLVSPCGGVLAPIKSNNTCDSWVACKRTCARYFCHMDSPDKAQYNTEDITCFGGFDFWNLVNSTSNKYDTIRSILKFCRQEHIESFADLLDYCIEYNEQWYMCLCDTGVYMVKEYLKSRSWQYDKARKFYFKEAEEKKKNTSENT